MEECKKAGNEDMVYQFASTSKMSMAGSGISAVAASKNNIESLLKLMNAQMISFDKVNQLRHVRFFKDVNGLREHMMKQADILMVVAKYKESIPDYIYDKFLTVEVKPY